MLLPGICRFVVNPWRTHPHPHCYYQCSDPDSHRNAANHPHHGRAIRNPQPADRHHHVYTYSHRNIHRNPNGHRFADPVPAPNQHLYSSTANFHVYIDSTYQHFYTPATDGNLYEYHCAANSNFYTDP